MNSQIFQNPQNLWGRWVSAKASKQYALLVGLSLLILYLPLFAYWQQSVQFHQLNNKTVHQAESLVHQQKILAGLKQQAQDQLLTPELATRLTPINQQLQQLSQEVSIQSSQWRFNRTPILHLQLQGHFQKTQTFLSALFRQFPQFSVLSLQITRLDDVDLARSIETDISLQLNKE